MRLLFSPKSRLLKRFMFLLVGALICASGSAVYAIACNNDCKKLTEGV